jgi:hypothetical protein
MQWFDYASNGSAFGYVKVTVDGKEAGTAQTDLQTLFSFSPDNKYFGFRTNCTYGATSFGHSLTVISLVSGTMMEIRSPHAERNPSNDALESYTWHGDTIDVVSYLVTPEYTEQPAKLTYYRTTPKELWRYDLSAKQYTLLETLPE